MTASVVQQDEQARQCHLKAVETAFQEARTGSLNDRVYTALRHAILVGDLPPQTKLGETELTSVLPVSRTPLREAFRRLEAEQLIVSTPSKGVVVRGMSPRDLLEVYQTLSALESFAVGLATSRISEQTMDELQAHIDLARFHAERERWDDMLEHSVAFHTILVTSSNNSHLARLIRDLRETTHSFRRFHLRTKEEWSRGMDQHQEVLNALRLRDPDLASQWMKRHLEGSTRLLSHELVQDEADDSAAGNRNSKLV